MTLTSFIAQKREQEMRAWFDALPDHEAVRCADAYYEAVNRLRQVRFNTQCHLCDDCGFVFPPDDLTQLVKSDGKRYLLCLECMDFTEMVRAIFGRAA